MSKMQRHIGVHLSDDEMKLVEGAETGAFKSPIPTQVISNGEWNAPPQSAQQKQVEDLIKEMGDTNAKRHGIIPSRILSHVGRYGNGVHGDEQSVRPRV